MDIGVDDDAAAAAADATAILYVCNIKEYRNRTLYHFMVYTFHGGDSASINIAMIVT